MTECEFVHQCVRRREGEVYGLFSSEYSAVLLLLSKKFMHLLWSKPTEFSKVWHPLHGESKFCCSALNDEFLLLYHLVPFLSNTYYSRMFTTDEYLFNCTFSSPCLSIILRQLCISAKGFNATFLYGCKCCSLALLLLSLSLISMSVSICLSLSECDFSSRKQSKNSWEIDPSFQKGVFQSLYILLFQAFSRDKFKSISESHTAKKDRFPYF